MDPISPQSKRREDAISMLNAAIEAMNLARDISSVTSAKIAFRSVSTLLTTIRVCFLFCGDGLRIYVQSGLHGRQS